MACRSFDVIACQNDLNADVKLAIVRPVVNNIVRRGFLTGWPCQAVEVRKQLPLCRLLKECHNGIGGLSGCGVTTNKGVGLIATANNEQSRQRVKMSRGENGGAGLSHSTRRWSAGMLITQGTAGRGFSLWQITESRDR